MTPLDRGPRVARQALERGETQVLQLTQRGTRSCQAGEFARLGKRRVA